MTGENSIRAVPRIPTSSTLTFATICQFRSFSPIHHSDRVGPEVLIERSAKRRQFGKIVSSLTDAHHAALTQDPPDHDSCQNPSPSRLQIHHSSNDPTIPRHHQTLLVHLALRSPWLLVGTRRIHRDPPLRRLACFFRNPDGNLMRCGSRLFRREGREGSDRLHRRRRLITNCTVSHSLQEMRHIFSSLSRLPCQLPRYMMLSFWLIRLYKSCASRIVHVGEI
jgi:hypothetical protein